MNQSLINEPRLFVDPLQKIGIAGGDDVFSEQSKSQGATGRIVSDPNVVIAKNPEVILGSWCGKKFRPERVRARAGWDSISAVRDNQLFEIKSADILQPGPAALTDGVRQIHEILKRSSDRVSETRARAAG